MITVAWFLVTVALASFAVETAFMQLASAKRVLAAGVPMPLDIRLVSYFWLVVGYPADVAFNLTRGTWIFRELPRELLFTSRVKRHYRNSSGRRLDQAILWARILNAIMPEHV